jgi:UDP-galactopyranose mutase
MKYNFLIVGSGLFGSVFAREATDRGYKCLVIDKRDHIGGNCYTENVDGIDIHKYGPHIFHTSAKKIWDYVNRFAEFEQFELNVIANRNGKLFNLPFNMWTFYQMWGEKDPEQVRKIIADQQYRGEITNLEEQALSLVGKDIYENLIKDYTTKQWGRDPSLLPASIIRRLPVRFTYNNNYFNDTYQGIPKYGYTRLFENLLDGIEVELDVDFFKHREKLENISKRIVYTGPIDRFYDYEYGKLDYRSLRHENEILQRESFQGNVVVNYTDLETDYTRIIEHKFFHKNIKTDSTIITKEYPAKYTGENEPMYPVNDKENTEKLSRYQKISHSLKYILGGRLAEYKYYDMNQVVGSSLKCVKDISSED